MRIITYSFLLSICFVSVPAAAKYPGGLQPDDRIYLLNRSDYLFNRYRKEISVSRRYAGKYVKKYSFPKLRFAEYRMRPGDTLQTVAVRLGISVDSIATSSGIHFVYGATNGQRLLIPNFQGVLHLSRKKTTMRALSAKYDIEQVDIRRFNRFHNKIVPGGTPLFIPGAVMPAVEQAFFFGSAFKPPLPETVLTSRFGLRSDPLTGRKAFHGGWIWLRRAGRLSVRLITALWSMPAEREGMDCWL